MNKAANGIDVSAIARVGCAGWSLPRADWPAFIPDGSHLERYASRLNAVEINSSFYRPHSADTYARWAQSVPADFRFSVKLPKAITHEQKLEGATPLMDAFLEQCMALGDKLECLLIQLPPSLAFDARIADGFLQSLRNTYEGCIALEPRNAAWFTPQADELLSRLQVARVLADPVRHDAGRWPGGWQKFIYCRLHGSPRMYYSAYSTATLDALAVRMAQAGRDGAKVWCMFDNTAGGAAVPDALSLSTRLKQTAA